MLEALIQMLCSTQIGSNSHSFLELLNSILHQLCLFPDALSVTVLFSRVCSVLDVPVWSKLESGHLPSMQQLVQILDNEMKLNVHMESMPHHRS